jgi:TPR repeat protein
MTRTGRKLAWAAAILVIVAVAGFAFLWARNYTFEKAGAALKDGNYAEAASKLKVVASMGDSNAQALMGDLYALGWGVPKSDDEAIAWYRRAGVEREDARDPAAPSMYYIGRKYLGGEGIPRNEAEARKWFERSAQGGYAKATEQLAQMQAPNK